MTRTLESDTEDNTNTKTYGRTNRPDGAMETSYKDEVSM